MVRRRIGRLVIAPEGIRRCPTATSDMQDCSRAASRRSAIGVIRPGDVVRTADDEPLKIDG